ncbi:hypothetical protein H6F86_25615, partial [Phormidium sp. FACHB-592]|nr:hypothetical protein [Phormidium sp. FACHB-592]
MTEAAVDILERLLQQVPAARVAVVHILRTTTPLEPSLLNQAETQVVWAAFQRQYRAVVQDLTAAWGVP